MTYAIIKNAEIPVTKRTGGGRKSKYPFAQMEVGDGFDTPRDLGSYANKSDRRRSSVLNCAKSFAMHHNPTAKFTVRLLDKDTVRCVRIA